MIGVAKNKVCAGGIKIHILKIWTGGWQKNWSGPVAEKLVRTGGRQIVRPCGQNLIRKLVVSSKIRFESCWGGRKENWETICDEKGQFGKLLGWNRI